MKHKTPIAGSLVLARRRPLVEMLGSSRGEKEEGEKAQMEMCFEGQPVPDWRKTYAALESARPQRKKVVRTMKAAAAEGETELLRSLVRDSQRNPNFRDKDGVTAMHCAAKKGRLSALEWLCNMKADINSQTNSGSTAVMKAAQHNHVKCLEFLCQNYANVDLVNSNGATAMMQAVMQRSDECMMVLLKAKADVDKQKDTGYTALMLAARNGHFSQCASLVQVRAQLELIDNQGETALAKARKHKKADIVNLLTSHGPEIETAEDQPHTG